MDSQATFVQACPTCGRRLRIQVRYLGMKLTCQHCNGRFIAQEQRPQQESCSIWDDDDDRSVNTVMKQLENNLQKSGILSHGEILQN